MSQSQPTEAQWREIFETTVQNAVAGYIAWMCDDSRLLPHTRTGLTRRAAEFLDISFAAVESAVARHSAMLGQQGPKAN